MHQALLNLRESTLVELSYTDELKEKLKKTTEQDISDNDVMRFVFAALRDALDKLDA